VGRKPNTTKRLERWAKDPGHYIFEAVQTRDEHDLLHPVKQFPRKDYLVEMLRIMHNGESVENVIKSRQLMMSWIAVAYVSWLARFHDHRNIFIQSKKKEDAAVFVFDTDPSQARLSFIETHLPDYARQDIKWRYGKAIYPNGSRVEAIPQGPKHYESRVASYVVNDECTLQEMWANGMAALKPMITGGGRVLNIATVRAGAAYTEEMSTYMDGDVPKEDIIPGMWRFRSKSNAAATAIHYSADPDKDLSTEAGQAWYEEATTGYPGGVEGHLWQQHMEINFEASSSTRLIENWDALKPNIIIPPVPKHHQVGWQYWSGFDYGKRNKTVWGCYALDRNGNEHIMSEVAGSGLDLGGVPGIAEKMMSHEYWGECGRSIWADPSIWNENQARNKGGYTSIAKLLRDQGVLLKKSPIKGKEADTIATERLLHHYWADPDSPTLFIWRTAPVHIKQFKGLRYQDFTETTQADHAYKEDLIDRDNDSFDAWKYAESRRPDPSTFKAGPAPGTLEAVRERAIRAQRKQRRKHGRHL
jgi:hypothetical protein